LVGFLLGETIHLSPEHFAAQYVPPHSVTIPVDGHAAASSEDVTAIYRALYGTLAEDWIAAGLFTHVLHIVPGDPEAEEAWVSLGFGRHMTAGTRDTGPVEAGGLPDPPGVEIHMASTEDIDVVLGLAHTLALHHVQAPMFWPLLKSTREAVRLFTLESLKNPANPCFVAYQDGRPVGMQQFLVPGFTPPVVQKERNIYLYEGIVEAHARSSGLGRLMLSHSMEWARENGYDLCTLHWASGNPEGAPFWLKNRFVPVEHTMNRRIDERIAWAR
jgi:GNAT superfamily N-acetyltransferase